MRAQGQGPERSPHATMAQSSRKRSHGRNPLNTFGFARVARMPCDLGEFLLRTPHRVDPSIQDTVWYLHRTHDNQSITMILIHTTLNGMHLKFPLATPCMRRDILSIGNENAHFHCASRRLQSSMCEPAMHACPSSISTKSAASRTAAISAFIVNSTAPPDRREARTLIQCALGRAGCRTASTSIARKSRTS